MDGNLKLWHLAALGVAFALWQLRGPIGRFVKATWPRLKALLPFTPSTKAVAEKQAVQQEANLKVRTVEALERIAENTAKGPTP